MKQLFLVCVFSTVVISCNAFSGIFTPRLHFGFLPIGDQPPSSFPERLEAGNKYSQVFSLDFISKGLNSSKTIIQATLFTNNPDENLYIKEIVVTWDEQQEILLRNKNFDISDIRLEGNGFYLRRKNLLEINFVKLFKNKNIGDNFNCSFKITFSLDDKKDQVQVLEYGVVGFKGEYRSYLQQLLP